MALSPETKGNDRALIDDFSYVIAPEPNIAMRLGLGLLRLAGTRIRQREPSALAREQKTGHDGRRQLACMRAAYRFSSPSRLPIARPSRPRVEAHNANPRPGRCAS